MISPYYTHQQLIDALNVHLPEFRDQLIAHLSSLCAQLTIDLDRANVLLQDHATLRTDFNTHLIEDHPMDP